jgi:sec-independent protein translocase protein TatA
MFGLGPLELGIILAIVIVLFGAKRLPELGSGIGKAIKNFKSGMTEKEEIEVTAEKEQVTEPKSEP